MKKSLSMIVAAVVLAGWGAGLAAAGTNDPVVQQREQNQQKRIDQGVQSGALTQGEAGRQEANQARIHRNEARMKAKRDLSRADRRKLSREQNRASRALFRQKHLQRRLEMKE